MLEESKKCGYRMEKSVHRIVPFQTAIPRSTKTETWSLSVKHNVTSKHNSRIGKAVVHHDTLDYMK